MKSRLMWAVMLVLGFGLVSACGGGGGGGGTPGTVNAGAKTTAQTAHDATEESSNTGNTATHMANTSSIQLSSLVGEVSSGCTPSCAVTITSSGLSAPTSSAPHVSLAGRIKAMQSAYLASKPGPTIQQSYVAGCVHQTGDTTGVFEQAGSGTCSAASNQINIDYANGDSVEYSWDCSDSNGCTTTMTVVGGHYSGSYISYSLDWTDFYLDIQTTGRIMYDSFFNYDRCLNQNWHMTWAADNSSGITIQATTDFINLGNRYRATSNLTYDLQSNSASETGYWSLGGNTRWADIEVPQTFALCTAATYTENGHVLEYRNMNVRDDWSANTPWSVSASGSVQYDGAEIGHLDAGDYGQVNIHWNDGTTSPFDPWQDMWAGFMIIY